MLKTQDLEIRIGDRLLLKPTTLTVNTGDKIGLVGRNGAGKTTLFKTLAGLNTLELDTGSIATDGKISGNGAKMLASGDVVGASQVLGYLPQDPSDTSLDISVSDRVLSSRGFDKLMAKMMDTQAKMAIASDKGDRELSKKSMKDYDKAETAFLSLGGYSAQAEAFKILDGLGIDEKLHFEPLKILSGGQRRRVELARILFSGAKTLLLDEPTNHLDADSISWLRSFLQNYDGGFIVITHDVPLLQAVVNKVFYLDANRSEIDQYNLNWSRYMKQRTLDEQRRRRERLLALSESERLFKQGNKMRAKATKAVAAQQMLRRAEELKQIANTNIEQKIRVANINFPKPLPCSKTPLFANNLSKSYGSNEVFAGANLVIDKGSKVVILGLNGAGKTTMLKILAGILTPDTGEVEFGKGAKLGYYAQEHESLDTDKTIIENMQMSCPASMNDTDVRNVLGSFMFSGNDVYKKVEVLSGGEKTRLALATLVVSGANVLLLDEPTNNLDPASREEVLSAIRGYQGATILVTHDPGATKALKPDRVLLLPDADEDLWNDSYQELVELS